MSSILKILKEEIPSLNNFKTRLLLASFISLYALIFINIYDPFNLNIWERYRHFPFVGIGILLLTQSIFHYVFKPFRAKLYSILLYCILEVLIISIVFFILENHKFNTFNEIINEYSITLRHVGLIIIVPYFIGLWYIHLRFKMSQLNDRIQTISVDDKKLISITDENGNLKMAIKPDKLIYVKSAGNYLELFYLNTGELTKELIRGSIKEFEAKISKRKILRTHRSYIVNLEYLSSFKKTRKGYALMLEHASDEVIPISSSYKETFEDAIQKDVSH
jgi:hypothetical protein